MVYEKEIRKIISSHKNLLGLDNINKIDISLLGVGENNKSILVVVNTENHFVFRIALHDVSDVKKEHRKFMNLNMIPDGLGPKPLLFDSSRKIIPEVYSVLSYVEGKAVNKWSDKNLELHANALVKLHKKEFNYWIATKKKKKVFDLNKKFTMDLKGFKDVLNDPDVKLLLPKMKVYIQENNQLFTSMKKFHLIHGDTCNNNILFKDCKIRYVDWERLSIRDNAEDVARVYSKDFDMPPWFIRLSEKQVTRFINYYLKYHPDKTLNKRVEVWNNVLLFTDLLYFKWKLKHFKTETSVIPKKHYQHSARILVESFKKRLL